ncbi:hypothetical protein ACOI22_07115 [Glaciecola sp. 2405UD65-10]|uniref:hypothetical protein n=1 Tax=Glaciecola sp. 2405UD65-10 TaxID=3397244 RepID=UPI003B59ADA9
MLSRFTNSILLLSCLAPSVCWSGPDDVQINGFIGLGYMHESANNFVSLEKDEQEIIDIGLRFSYDFNSQFSATGQLGYRRFSDYANDHGPRVDYAQLSYLTSLFNNSEQIISIGRVKNQLGLYNLARDVPTGRNSIILPQSAYLEFLRNLFLSTDGISFSSNTFLDKGVLSASFSYGRVNIDENFSKNMLGDFTSGDWSNKQNLVADVRFSNEKFKIGVSYNDIEPHYNAANDDLIPFIPIGTYINGIDGQLGMQSYFAYAQIYWKQFEFSTEYTYRNVNANGFTAGQALNRSLEGYYAQLNYLKSAQLSLTLRFEQFYRLAKYKHGVVTPFFTFEPYYNNSRTLSFGAVYNFNDSWSIMADIHFVKGSGFLAPFATPVEETIEKKSWTLTAIQAVYNF